MPFDEEPSHALHVNSPTLESLSLPVEIFQRLDKAGFTTASEIILTQPGFLKSRTGLTSNVLKTLLDRLADTCSPKPVTILTQSQSGPPDTITLGSPSLDKLFGKGRGIRTGQLTEIAGESAAGKTCICLQLSLTVQLPRILGGLRGGCIYISSECHFPDSRLKEMALALCQREEVRTSLQSGDTTDKDFPEISVDQLMSNVYPNRISDREGLIHAIHYQLPALISQLPEHSSSPLPIRLIVLDSIGALFRPNGDHTKFSWTERSSQLNQIADGLKHLARLHNLAAVVINQVSDVFDVPARPARYGVDTRTDRATPPTSDSPVMQSSFKRSRTLSSSPNSSSNLEKGSPPQPLLYDVQARHFMGRGPAHRKEATLGVPWSNAVNVRIMIHRLNGLPHSLIGESSSHLQQNRSVREARVVFSPFGGEGNGYDSRGIRYFIDSAGIIALEDDDIPASSSLASQKA